MVDGLKGFSHLKRLIIDERAPWNAHDGDCLPPVQDDYLYHESHPYYFTWHPAQGVQADKADFCKSVFAQYPQLETIFYCRIILSLPRSQPSPNGQWVSRFVKALDNNDQESYEEIRLVVDSICSCTGCEVDEKRGSGWFY